MLNGGTEMLRQALIQAVEATKDATDPVSKGIYALCLDRLASIDAERKSVWCRVETTGWGTVVLTLCYLILKVHNIIP